MIIVIIIMIIMIIIITLIITIIMIIIMIIIIMIIIIILLIIMKTIFILTKIMLISIVPLPGMWLNLIQGNELFPFRSNFKLVSWNYFCVKRHRIYDFSLFFIFNILYKNKNKNNLNDFWKHRITHYLFLYYWKDF